MSRFRPGWRLTLFVAFFLPVLISLGLWQLARADEKQLLIEQYMQSLSGLPVNISSRRVSEFGNFQRTRLIGQFTEEIFLLDNQVNQGQVGYWVVQGFDADSGQRFLVNRGFVAALQDRARLPSIETPVERLNTVAVVWPDTGLPPIWRDDQWLSAWPLRIQRMDIAKMAQLTDAVPVELRLEDGQPGVLRAAPLVTTLDDAKHLGYSATWFGLAVTLFVGYIFVGVRLAAQARLNQQR